MVGITARVSIEVSEESEDVQNRYDHIGLLEYVDFAHVSQGSFIIQPFASSRGC